MKYKVGESEKFTKDDKKYQVWKISEKAGFFLSDGVAGEEAQELIDRIIASACALAVKLETDSGAVCEAKQPVAAEDITQGSAVKDCGKPQKQTNVQKTPEVYLLRKRTGERIPIDKELFKLGKDAACVDYVVDDNPTISRNHANIECKKDGCYVKDKGSLNHTFVNGKKLEPEKPVKLEAGSLLQLADEVFEFLEEV